MVKNLLLSAGFVVGVAGVGFASGQAVMQIGPGPIGDGTRPAGHGAILYDNGDTDGHNGYSTWNQIGRWIYDDFVVPDPGWIDQDFHVYHLWNSGAIGVGTDMVVDFYLDNGGVPGAFHQGATGRVYSEIPTGRVWFGRPELEVCVDFDDLILAPGRYWVAYSVARPENGFSMVRQGITGSELWWRADDIGFFGPGSQNFGVQADGAWWITGQVIPAPGALALLGLGGLAAIRRRR